MNEDYKPLTLGRPGDAHGVVARVPALKGRANSGPRLGALHVVFERHLLPRFRALVTPQTWVKLMDIVAVAASLF